MCRKVTLFTVALQRQMLVLFGVKKKSMHSFEKDNSKHTQTLNHTWTLPQTTSRTMWQKWQVDAMCILVFGAFDESMLHFFWPLVAWVHVNERGITEHAVNMWSSASPWVVAWAATTKLDSCVVICTNTLTGMYISITNSF